MLFEVKLNIQGTFCPDSKSEKVYIFYPNGDKYEVKF